MVIRVDQMRMERHHDSQRSSRLAVTQPMYPPSGTSRTEKQLTARADRPLHDPAHAVAFTTAVAVGGTGSVHRRIRMRAAPTLPGGEGSRPGSLPATDCQQTHRRRCRSITLVSPSPQSPRGTPT